MCLNMSAMLLCCVLRLISCLKSLRGCHTVCLSWWVSVLSLFGHLWYNGAIASQVSLQETKEVNLNDLNCTGCRGPLISMLFLPSVNFDYGEMPVMALLSFLSFSRSFWLQGVGGVEELIGNCRAHCLQIHGFLDWPASGSETHQLLQTHKRTSHTYPNTHAHVICIPFSHPCTETQPSQSAFSSHHIYVLDVNIHKVCYAAHSRGNHTEKIWWWE